MTRHPSPSFVLEGVASLVDKSLVRQAMAEDGEPRFAMLETIREFALERLDAGGAAAEARRRHAEWCVVMAEEANAHMERPELVVWWPRLVAEHDNLRAALAWLEARGDPETMLRLAAALGSFWYHDSHLSEGRHWLARALAAGAGAPAALRAAALTGAALLAHFHDDDGAAVALCAEALALWRDLGDQTGLARVWYVEGLVHEDAGRYAAAAERFAEALTRFEAGGSAFWAGLARGHLGIAAYGRGDLARARALLREALGGHRERGFRWATGHALLYLAQVALAGGDPAAARPALAEAIAIALELGAPRSIAPDVLATAAAFGVAIGQPGPGARLLGWAAAARELSGTTSRLPERVLYDRAEAEARAALGGPAFAAAWAAGRALAAEQAFAEARAIVTEGGPAAPSSDEAQGLTPRELEILRLLAAGQANKEIAAALGISRHTVAHHVARILAQLGVESRSAAAAHAVRHGLA